MTPPGSHPGSGRGCIVSFPGLWKPELQNGRRICIDPSVAGYLDELASKSIYGSATAVRHLDFRPDFNHLAIHHQPPPGVHPGLRFLPGKSALQF